MAKSTIKEQVRKAVLDLQVAQGYAKDIYHPELGWVVKDGKPTKQLIAFVKKLKGRQKNKVGYH